MQTNKNFTHTIVHFKNKVLLPILLIGLSNLLFYLLLIPTNNSEISQQISSLPNHPKHIQVELPLAVMIPLSTTPTSKVPISLYSQPSGTLITTAWLVPNKISRLRKQDQTPFNSSNNNKLYYRVELPYLLLSKIVKLAVEDRVLALPHLPTTSQTQTASDRRVREVIF
ncbi:MAG: hypothetical protein HN353_10500 [Bdellovibrionales bacterium]|nr:hypothetical protein [Bdellovibrionales bacterium]MBT3524723.1 hypothetical protein [Bdellovibrionales bacterium]MBT7668765.1 hypothetical protein [Bdellovibrionales bacterium]MBT7766938.1 hypothetical protein [Bdellovibrionales bacterium]